jgi:hypothetical protein
MHSLMDDYRDAEATYCRCNNGENYLLPFREDVVVVSEQWVSI